MVPCRPAEMNLKLQKPRPKQIWQVQNGWPAQASDGRGINLHLLKLYFLAGEDAANLAVSTMSGADYESYVAEGRLAVQPYLNFSYLPQTAEPYFSEVHESSAMLPCATDSEGLEARAEEQQTEEADCGYVWGGRMLWTPYAHYCARIQLNSSRCSASAPQEHAMDVQSACINFQGRKECAPVL